MPDGFGEVRRLAVALSNAADAVQDRADLALRKAAFDVEDLAKQYAPVDTGFLRDSIGTSMVYDMAIIGPTAHYGAFVEFGTSRQQPRPYMAPAADAVIPGLEKALQQIGIDAILKGG